MNYLAKLLFLTLIVAVFSVSAEDDIEPPFVVETTPSAGDMNVDPTTSEIIVTFSEPMTNGFMSYGSEDKESFPEPTDIPSFQPGLTTVVLPVKLEPNKRYEVLINSKELQTFRDQAGNTAVPFVLVFKTGE